MKKNQTNMIIQGIILIVAILAIYAVQLYHLETSLQNNADLANKQLENLKANMEEDGISPEVRNHISKVAENATFQTKLLIGSLSRTQLYSQSIVLLMICISAFSFNRANQTE